jgi:anion-transporting  ArsA/GET3 family ATPase
LQVQVILLPYIKAAESQQS